MTVVDVTERLMAEFEDRLSLPEITRVVARCRQDLQGTPAGALPELVERSARQRLLSASRAKATDTGAPSSALPAPRRPRVLRLPD